MSHPLFPPDEDGEAPQVLKIHVLRYEGGAKPVWCPRLFDAAELQSLEDIHGLFGGGTYELIGRDATNITARVTYAIPGKSRSLLGEEEPQGEAPGPGGGLATADPNVQLIGLLVQMMQQQSQVQMSFLQSMMQSQAASSREHVQMMQAALSSQNQGTAQLYETLLKAGQGGGADVNSVLEAIKVGVDLHSGASEQGEDFDFDKASEKAFKVIEMVQGLAAKKGSAAPVTPPNGAARHPPTEPAPAPEPDNADLSE